VWCTYRSVRGGVGRIGHGGHEAIGKLGLGMSTVSTKVRELRIEDFEIL
jgi:hypothetical protein